MFLWLFVIKNKGLLLFLIINFKAIPPKVTCTNWKTLNLNIIRISLHYDSANWVAFLVLIVSNDIELNPGDYLRNGFLSFCNWNINTLGKDNFQLASLIEAHNSLFNYEIICLCETSLNDSIIIPQKLIDNYKFISSNSSGGKKQGDVGIYYKESLPLKVRHDLDFAECIVTELSFVGKKIFFAVLYRNPCDKVDSPNLLSFWTHLKISIFK